MPHIPPITDAYIDEIIKAPDAFNPTLNKTQGVKLRELIKLMRDKIQSSNSGEDSEVVINEYNPSKSYAIGDVVYVKDEYGNRILYQSLINNNINTFYSGGLAIPNVEFGNPAPIIGLEGIILPFPLYGYEYDENLTFTYKGYYLENNEYKPYDAFTVKLKKQDGRRFGFYFSQTTVPPNAQPPVPTFDYVTIKIKTSNDESQNTEIIADKIVADNLRFYYETPEGLRLKIKLDISTNEQVIDISGIITGWYLLGYPEFKLDTSGFLDTSEQPQTKAGPLQLNSNFSNKQKRVLYSINPYNQRDTQNGYIEEITEQYDVDGEQVGNFVILGNHFSEGYFTNSIELAVTSYNGSINKKWSLFSDTIRGGNWFTVLPVNEGVQYNGGGDVDLEVKYVYPYGYWFRLRVKTAGGIGGIALYTKSYQGTFYKWNTYNENVIGPQTGNDILPTDDTIGDKEYAKSLKVYSAPIEDNDVVRLKDLNDHGGNSPTEQYIQASPSAPQVANINLDGDISVNGGLFYKSLDLNNTFFSKANDDGSFIVYNDATGAGWAANADGLYNPNNNRKYVQEKTDAEFNSLNVTGNANIGSGGSLTTINSFGLEEHKPLYLSTENHYLSTATNISFANGDLAVNREDEGFKTVLLQGDALPITGGTIRGNLVVNGECDLNGNIISTVNGNIFRYVHGSDGMIFGGYIGGDNFSAYSITNKASGKHFKSFLAPIEPDDVLRLGDVQGSYLSLVGGILSGDLAISNGEIEINDFSKGIILRSPNGSRFRITVDNSGALQTTSL
ncbi:hypothetical protein ASU31_13510 [Pedobacter ginsenosidimutans]|uniref:Uncharacterized protein n=1 Tax=Pedobacter ginsenosidimutans TaxID=687842 RepID=A0A0T5VPD8_9SPHI|nr:hypothetical protein [Pedobacter ginsenosidimutans]KRT15677.1 hypothetical protein ASU31_13510 [Pedobacter ginsenosidimutans]